jgi:hypothetical protein
MTADASARELADGFVSAIASGRLPASATISVADLVFSVESLKSVDAYLSALHELSQPSASGQGVVGVLKGLFGRGDRRGNGPTAFDIMGSRADAELVRSVGAYFGEVLKKHSLRNYRWISYGDARNQHGLSEDIIGPESICNSFVLHAQANEFLFPIVRCFRFVANGSEESTYTFAVLQLRHDAK